MTTTPLVLCTACARHVRADERACPFCGAPSPRPLSARVSAAAVALAASLALGACVEEAYAQSRSRPRPLYGLPPPRLRLDASVGPGAARDAAAATPSARADGGAARAGLDAAAPSIGAATMERDGTLVLTLRATGAGGAVGDGVLRYPPAHPQYPFILRHLGGAMRPGETRPVAPFPDP